MTNKHWETKRRLKELGKKIGWAALGCGAALGIGALGYGLGGKFSEFRIALGLERACNADPTLKEHLTEALLKLQSPD